MKPFSSGYAGVPQFRVIGAYAFVGAMALVTKDVPAYVAVDGNPAGAVGLNVERLRRLGLGDDVKKALQDAYSLVYRRGLTLKEALVELRPAARAVPEVACFVAPSKRPSTASSASAGASSRLAGMRRPGLPPVIATASAADQLPGEARAARPSSRRIGRFGLSALRIGIVAGEASGDILGGRLMAAVRARQPDVRFFGVGGEAMRAEGLDALASLDALAVNGFKDPIVRLPSLYRLLRTLRRHFVRERMDVVVGVDFNVFNLLLERGVRKRGIRLPTTSAHRSTSGGPAASRASPNRRTWCWPCTPSSRRCTASGALGRCSSAIPWRMKSA